MNKFYFIVNAFAKANSQTARVIDNNDPEGMGRVKVDFFFEASWKNTSDWMRLVQRDVLT